VALAAVALVPEVFCGFDLAVGLRQKGFYDYYFSFFALDLYLFLGSSRDSQQGPEGLVLAVERLVQENTTDSAQPVGHTDVLALHERRRDRCHDDAPQDLQEFARPLAIARSKQALEDGVSFNVEGLQQSATETNTKTT